MNSESSGAIKLRPPFWSLIFRSLPAVYAAALYLGWYFEPLAIHNSPISDIYLEGANTLPISGKVVFGMTKYLMFFRKGDGQFIAIPYSRVQRIETSRAPSLMPTPTVTPTPTAAPAPTAAPLPSPCPTIKTNP